MLALIKEKQLLIQNNSQPVQGSVGEQLRMQFSEDWEGLSITAVFSAGSVHRDVAVEGDTLTIPWELYIGEGHALWLNFHGARSDGSVVLRTPRVCLGLIRRSDAPSGSAPEAPTPSRADQIQALAEQALAAAQALRSDAASGTFDGYSPAVSVTDITGGHRVTVTDKNGSACFDVMDGRDWDEDVFIAVCGTTGAAAIEAAWQAGKVCLCARGGALYTLCGRVEGGALPDFSFALAEADGFRYLDCSGSSVWSERFSPFRSAAAPAMDGTAAAGTAATFARSDHVHPSDSGKLDAARGAAIEEEALKAFPVGSASGVIASFYDGADDIPVSGLTAAVTPTQSGSGDPAPDNVRPISGYTSCMVIQSGADTDLVTDSHTVSWQTAAGTVYRGTLDVTRGLLTVTHTLLTASKISDWSIDTDHGRVYKKLTELASSANNRVADGLMCSRFKPVSVDSILNDGAQGVGVSSQSMLSFRITGLTDTPPVTSEAVQAYFGSNPTFVLAKLAVPAVYQLAPTEIRSLSGANKIWASTGNVSVQYRADPTLYIPKTASGVGAVAADQGSANAGKFLVVGNDGAVAPVTMTAWSGGNY